jgi:hypothetical protein
MEDLRTKNMADPEKDNCALTSVKKVLVPMQIRIQVSFFESLSRDTGGLDDWHFLRKIRADSFRNPDLHSEAVFGSKILATASKSNQPFNMTAYGILKKFRG